MAARLPSTSASFGWTPFGQGSDARRSAPISCQTRNRFLPENQTSKGAGLSFIAPASPSCYPSSACVSPLSTGSPFVPLPHEVKNKTPTRRTKGKKMLGIGKDSIEGNQPISSVQAASNVVHGDCIQVLSQVSSESVDFVLTDPPYIAKYVSRDGQKIANDDRADWLQPAFKQISRVLKKTPFASVFTDGTKWTNSCRLGGLQDSDPLGIWFFKSHIHQKKFSCRTDTRCVLTGKRKSETAGAANQ